MSLLAVDMGSSSCKAIAFSPDGRMLAERRQSYSPDIPRPSWAEMPAEKFGFKPTPEQMSFGHLAGHIVEGNYFFCAKTTIESFVPMVSKYRKVNRFNDS